MITVQPTNDSFSLKNPSVLTRLCYFFAVLSFIGGFLFLSHVLKKVDQVDRQDLLTQVQTISHLISAQDIATLTGTEKDLDSPVYLKIKQEMYDLHDINNNTRFVYLMRASDTDPNKLIFLVDSEIPSSKDYSWPGQIYDNTTPLQMKNYLEGVPFTEGPYTDNWGTWISAYAPIWYNGKIVAKVCMDVSATKWRAEDYYFQVAILTMSIITSIVFIFIGIYIKRAVQCIDEVEHLQKDLENKQSLKK